MPEIKTLYHDGKVAPSSFKLLIKRAQQGLPLEVWGDPEKGIDIIYIKDFCQEVARGLLCDRQKGGIYNVGTGVKTTLAEWISAIRDVFSPEDKKSELVFCPEKPDCVGYFMNVDKAKQELGYIPQYDVHAALEDYKQEMEQKRFADFFIEKYGSCE